MVEVNPRIGMSVSVPLQRTWQRKWRDVLYYRESIAEEYERGELRVDQLTRCGESFFKTCHELIDWIDESTSLKARAFARKSEALKLCDAAAQTAKHYRRDNDDKVTFEVVELYGSQSGHVIAQVKWTSARNSGSADALKLADDCIAEWERFFQLCGVDPNA